MSHLEKEGKSTAKEPASAHPWRWFGAIIVWVVICIAAVATAGAFANGALHG